ncbi:MAG: cyclic-di-AMP receptor, partial [Oscillospiraceae bacterium]|nr:cyclic-di-AMP receptor [Oscillospiraceae bacterium]
SQLISATSGVAREFPTGMPVEVRVGGATIFVVDVEQFQRI